MTTVLRPAVPRPTRRARSVDPVTGPVLRIWVLSRLTTMLLVGSAAYLFATEGREPPPSYLSRWVQWDVVHLQEVATRGYADPGSSTPLAAFLPGLPVLLRLLSSLGIGLTVGGLLISFVAGAMAVVALARLAELDGPPGAGPRAVLLLILAPSAVFLAAGYTEALFLGFAVPAWLCARTGRWWWAGVLAAFAATVRISGVFLAVALVVEFLTRSRDRRARDALALVLPGLPLAGFAGYLHVATGDWLGWLHAQKEGWQREFTAPVQALRTTWDAAFGGSQPLGFAWMFRAELVAIVVGVVLTAVLLWRRRWGEATFVGLQVAAFATSTWYLSVLRATLLWWPLWILLAQASLRRAAVLPAYVTLVAPFMVVFACLFGVGRWAG